MDTELKRILLLPKEETMQLDDLYYRESLGERIWNDILQVNSFIRFLPEIQPKSVSAAVRAEGISRQIPGKSAHEHICYLKGIQNVENGFSELLQEARSERELSFFLPASAQTFYTILRQFIVGAPSDFHIRQITGIPSGRVADRGETTGVFQELLNFLSSRSNVQMECRYYYNAVSRVSDIGVLYPWYVLCGINVLMISSDFTTAVLLKSEELANAFADRFEKAFAESTPMMKSYDALEQNLQAIRAFLKGKQEVNYEAIPCTAMIATPEMICKYVIPQAQEELIAHCEALQREETMIDIASFSGLRRFLKERRIPEIPESFMREMEPEDLIWYLDVLLERLGTTLFMIDESRIPAAYDWDITIVEEFSILIHHHNYNTMILDEKNLVDMFTSFAMHVSETPLVMDTEKARKEMLDIRVELVHQLYQLH